MAAFAFSTLRYTARIALGCLLFVLLVLGGSTCAPRVAQAQKLQPTPVRFLRGEPVVVFSQTTLPGIFPAAQATSFSMSGFSGLSVTVTTFKSDGTATTPPACAKYPQLIVSESATGATGTFAWAATQASSFIISAQANTLTYYVPVGRPYALLSLYGAAGTTGGFVDCKVTVTATPLAYPDDNNNAMSPLSNLVTVTPVVTPVTLPSSARTSILQNKGTVPVGCHAVQGSLTSVATGSFELSAASGASKGDGGSVTFAGGAATIFCIVDAGSAVVGVTGY